MIVSLRGELVESYPTHLVIEVNGVGYEVAVPLSTYERLPMPPATVRLLTYHQVTEDAQRLYGFSTAEERDLFKLLVTHVGGIGPKSALSILSGASPAQFKAAVVANDVAGLSKFKGIGRKTAERLLVELRDKIGASAAWEAASGKLALTPAEQLLADAVLALIALGYKQVEAHKAAAAVQKVRPNATVEELVREGLKQLG